MSWSRRALPVHLGGVCTWDVSSLRQLPGVRRGLREMLADGAGTPGPDHPAAERLVLTVDELLSNALRHGVPPIRARVTSGAGCWLVDVSDGAVHEPPRAAVGRDPALGGMGLRLVTAFAAARGWCVTGPRKHVWAVLSHVVDEHPAAAAG